MLNNDFVIDYKRNALSFFINRSDILKGSQLQNIFLPSGRSIRYNNIKILTRSKQHEISISGLRNNRNERY